LVQHDVLLLKFLWGAAALLALYLVWKGTYPPFIDAANVAYSGEVLHDIWSKGGAFSHWYVVRRGALSHLLFYFAYHELRYLFAGLICIKLLATFSIFAPAITMVALLRAMKLSPWLSLPVIALGFNTNLGMGFLPFTVGLFLIPLVLLLVEKISEHFTWWYLLALAALLFISPVVHYFLTAILFPIALSWSLLSLRGRSRSWSVALEVLVGICLVAFLAPKSVAPPLQNVVQWSTYVEKWELLDRDVFKWTVDGPAALSFPILLVAFVSSLVLCRSTPDLKQGLRAYRAPTLLLILFIAFLVGPTSVSWPEPAWGIGARIAIAMAFVLLLIPMTSARGWRRFIQHSPWVAFTFWHLCALIPPFLAYDRLTGPLHSFVSLVPPHSKLLPVYGSKELRDPKKYSFGGFAGAAALHIGKWLAVETLSYQPWSFCDAGYHPMQCSARLRAPNESQPLNITTAAIRDYDFIVALENDAAVREKLTRLPLVLVRREGAWSLWRVL